MDYKAMNAKIKDIHQKSGKSRVWIFFDMVHCGRKFGAGYMDYWLYEMYNLTDEERDTYITRGRNYDLVKRYNNPAYTDLIDNKIEFNKRFGEFLGRKWIEIRKDNKQEVIDFINDHDFLMAKADLGSCGKTVEKVDCKAEPAEAIYERLVNMERPHFFEEMIVQHPAVSAIYPYAINTVRLVTIQRDGKVHVARRLRQILACAGILARLCRQSCQQLWGKAHRAAGGRFRHEGAQGLGRSGKDEACAGPEDKAAVPKLPARVDEACLVRAGIAHRNGKRARHVPGRLVDAQAMLPLHFSLPLACPERGLDDAEKLARCGIDGCAGLRVHAGNAGAKAAVQPGQHPPEVGLRPALQADVQAGLHEEDGL